MPNIGCGALVGRGFSFVIEDADALGVIPNCNVVELEATGAKLMTGVSLVVDDDDDDDGVVDVVPNERILALVVTAGGIDEIFCLVVVVGGVAILGSLVTTSPVLLDRTGPLSTIGVG